MNFILPKPLLFAFLTAAFIYLGLVSFITYPYTTLLKPLPIIFLIIAVLASDLSQRSKALMVSALSFSLLGDIVLTLPSGLSIELGIGCFLLAHCFYIILFFKIFKYRFSYLVSYSMVMVFMGYSASIIIPTVGALLIPVIIYFCILMIMVFGAFQVNSQKLVIGGGALCFALSDLSIAFNLFVYPQIDGKIFIMGSYYLAQLLLIWGLVTVYTDPKNKAYFDNETGGDKQFPAPFYSN